MSWDIKKLSEVCSYDKNQGIHKSLPYIGLENIESSSGRLISYSEGISDVKSSTFMFSKEHLLYGRLRPYLNKVYLPTFTGHCSTEIFPIKPKKGLLREYLWYWFIQNSTVNSINATCTGARMPRANMNAVMDFTIPVPPLSTQQKLVAKLDAIFTEIDKATAAAEANAKNAEALFQSYLTQVFERQNDNNILTTLGEYYDVRDGTHDSPKFYDSGYPLVTSKNLKNGSISFEKIQYISKEDYLSISQRSGVKKGDVLIAMIGTIGNPVVVETDDEFAIKNVALFKTNSNQSPLFLRYYLGSDYVKRKMESDAKGATQKFVGLGYLRSFPISVPVLSSQLSIVRELEEYEQYTNRLSTSNVDKTKQLLAFKQSILRQAFAGELVKE